MTKLTSATGATWISAGTRVRVAAYTDAWMKGDRYGEVVKTALSRTSREMVTRVLMDKSGRTLRFRTDDLEVL